MFAEYSMRLGSLKQAKSMLSQFTIVGVTEQEDAFLRRLCKHLALPTERCTDNTTPERKALMAIYSHYYPPHPKLKDFSEAFRENVSQWLQTDYQIYDVAESLSRESDAREIAPVLRESLVLAQSLPQPGMPCQHDHRPCVAQSEEMAATALHGGVRHVPFRHTSSTGVTSVLCLIEKAGSTAWLALVAYDRSLAPVQRAGSLATVAPPVLTMVRNPYVRFLSAYLDKVAPHQRGFTFNGTFAAFAHHLASCAPTRGGDTSCAGDDKHLAPQLSLCHLSAGFRYDLVLRLEEMPLWYEAVIDLLGLRVAAQGYGTAHHGPYACFYHPVGVGCDELFGAAGRRSYGGVCR